MSEKVGIINWSFGIIPQRGAGDIVSLFGYDLTGKFISGTNRIVSFDRAKMIAKTDSGKEYYLGCIDPQTIKMYTDENGVEHHFDVLEQAIEENKNSRPKWSSK